MSDDSKEQAGDVGWEPAYLPTPERYAPPSVADPEPDATQPQWPGETEVYPPPPEMYLERARAAPTFVTPSYSSPYEASQTRAEPARPRRRWRRARYAHQPITELDIALLIISAAVSFAVYAMILTWPVGLGLTLLIFAHEMGHFVVIRAKGLPVRLPIFIPLMGAFVLMGVGPMDARDEAEIALAGPFAGTLGSIACVIAYIPTHQPTLLTIAFINLAINLFNMLPLGPLDGGRATRAISKWLLALWLIVLVVISFCTFDLLMGLLSGAALIQVLFLRDRDPSMIYYTRTPRRERNYVTALYFGLVGVMLATAVGALAATGWLGLIGGLFRLIY